MTIEDSVEKKFFSVLDSDIKNFKHVDSAEKDFNEKTDSAQESDVKPIDPALSHTTPVKKTAERPEKVEKPAESSVVLVPVPQAVNEVNAKDPFKDGNTLETDSKSSQSDANNSSALSDSNAKDTNASKSIAEVSKQESDVIPAKNAVDRSVSDRTLELSAIQEEEDDVKTEKLHSADDDVKTELPSVEIPAIRGSITQAVDTQAKDVDTHTNSGDAQSGSSTQLTTNGTIKQLPTSAMKTMTLDEPEDRTKSLSQKAQQRFSTFPTAPDNPCKGIMSRQDLKSPMGNVALYSDNVNLPLNGHLVQRYGKWDPLESLSGMLKNATGTRASIAVSSPARSTRSIDKNRALSPHRISSVSPRAYELGVIQKAAFLSSSSRNMGARYDAMKCDNTSSPMHPFIYPSHSSKDSLGASGLSHTEALMERVKTDMFRSSYSQVVSNSKLLGKISSRKSSPSATAPKPPPLPPTISDIETSTREQRSRDQRAQIQQSHAAQSYPARSQRSYPPLETRSTRPKENPFFADSQEFKSTIHMPYNITLRKEVQSFLKPPSKSTTSEDSLHSENYREFCQEYKRLRDELTSSFERCNNDEKKSPSVKGYVPYTSTTSHIPWNGGSHVPSTISVLSGSSALGGNGVGNMVTRSVSSKYPEQLLREENVPNAFGNKYSRWTIKNDNDSLGTSIRGGSQNGKSAMDELMESYADIAHVDSSRFNKARPKSPLYQRTKQLIAERQLEQHRETHAVQHNPERVYGSQLTRNLHANVPYTSNQYQVGDVETISRHHPFTTTVSAHGSKETNSTDGKCPSSSSNCLADIRTRVLNDRLVEAMAPLEDFNTERNFVWQKAQELKASGSSLVKSGGNLVTGPSSSSGVPTLSRPPTLSNPGTLRNPAGSSTVGGSAAGSGTNSFTLTAGLGSAAPPSSSIGGAGTSAISGSTPVMASVSPSTGDGQSRFSSFGDLAKASAASATSAVSTFDASASAASASIVDGAGGLGSNRNLKEGGRIISRMPLFGGRYPSSDEILRNPTGMEKPSLPDKTDLAGKVYPCGRPSVHPLLGSSLIRDLPSTLDKLNGDYRADFLRKSDFRKKSDSNLLNKDEDSKESAIPSVSGSTRTVLGHTQTEGVDQLKKTTDTATQDDLKYSDLNNSDLLNSALLKSDRLFKTDVSDELMKFQKTTSPHEPSPGDSIIHSTLHDRFFEFYTEGNHEMPYDSHGKNSKVSTVSEKYPEANPLLSNSADKRRAMEEGIPKRGTGESMMSEAEIDRFLHSAAVSCDADNIDRLFGVTEEIMATRPSSGKPSPYKGGSHLAAIHNPNSASVYPAATPNSVVGNSNSYAKKDTRIPSNSPTLSTATAPYSGTYSVSGQQYNGSAPVTPNLFGTFPGQSHILEAGVVGGGNSSSNIYYGNGEILPRDQMRQSPHNTPADLQYSSKSVRRSTSREAHVNIRNSGYEERKSYEDRKAYDDRKTYDEKKNSMQRQSRSKEPADSLMASHDRFRQSAGAVPILDGLPLHAFHPPAPAGTWHPTLVKLDPHIYPTQRITRHKEAVFDQVTCAAPKVSLDVYSFQEHAKAMAKFRKQTQYRGWVP